MRSLNIQEQQLIQRLASVIQSLDLENPRWMQKDPKYEARMTVQNGFPPIERGDFLAYHIPGIGFDPAVGYTALDQIAPVVRGGIVFVVKSFDTHSGNADVISFDEQHSEWKERTLLIFVNKQLRVPKAGLFWFRPGKSRFCDFEWPIDA